MDPVTDLEVTVTFDRDEWIVVCAAALLAGCSTTELIAEWCTAQVIEAAGDTQTARLANAIKEVL